MPNESRLLATRLADLLAREHGALADFLVALAEFDRERRWLELGHASLFSFLNRELGLSKGAASYRNAAAALIQRCPEVVAPLRSGKLCLSTVVELSRVLTPENQRTVLPRFLGASKWEAKVIAAELCPAESPQRRAVVTAVSPVVPAAVARPMSAAPPLP
ncbi:MAG: HNH endonuclease, partial [Anaeromyxobacteraceae bacterium]